MKYVVGQIVSHAYYLSISWTQNWFFPAEEILISIGRVSCARCSQQLSSVRDSHYRNVAHAITR